MIPADAITNSPISGAFQPPENLPYNPSQHTVLGGIAIGDPSKGRQFQNWTAILAAGNVTVQPSNSGVVFSIAAPSATSIALAFDNNMGLVLAWQTLTESVLYYFDTTTAAYTARSFAGTTSCRVCVDDAREFYGPSSDVIFAYTENNNLYWRQQRDRYDVERLVGPTGKKLVRMGLAQTNRLQFECL